MPLIHVTLPKDRLTAEAKTRLADGLMSAVLKAERLDDTEFTRSVSWVIFHEIDAANWIAPGSSRAGDARYLVNVVVPQGMLDPAGKQLAVSLTTDALREVEGADVDFAAHGPWVHINEVPDGNWGAAGTIVQTGVITQYLGSESLEAAQAVELAAVRRGSER